MTKKLVDRYEGHPWDQKPGWVTEQYSTDSKPLKMFWAAFFLFISLRATSQGNLRRCLFMWYH